MVYDRNIYRFLFRFFSPKFIQCLFYLLECALFGALLVKKNFATVKFKISHSVCQWVNFRSPALCPCEAISLLFTRARSRQESSHAGLESCSNWGKTTEECRQGTEWVFQTLMTYLTLIMQYKILKLNTSEIVVMVNTIKIGNQWTLSIVYRI